MTIVFELAQRAVIVTGGTHGIGRGIAERFLEAGAEVLVCARQAPVSPISAAGREAVFVPANVRVPEDVARVFAAAQARFGRLDVLVNNAGGSPPVEAATASSKFFAAVIDLNLTAAFVVAQHANAVMQRQAEGGCIINIASVSATRPSPGTAAYGAAKAGLLSLTQSLAVEWAPKVRVNAVTPGLILTERAEQHYGAESSLEAIAATVPLGRFGTAREVADACLFFASPLASYVSGASLVLHGGGEQPAFLAAAKAPR